MTSDNLVQGWVRVRLSDSRKADLACLKDQKGNLVKVYDYAGNELKHNTGARSVNWRGEIWRY
ncbi:hypothetical protein [Acinetobacter calcoaceticus]|uniref:hypothetical protein n=1 Tax=Acinetobacter calcoaceticus TaxID=471 RepID=UPI0018DD9EC5|nr:hypothetical protein [Acinetobacter calcoaceticus]